MTADSASLTAERPLAWRAALRREVTLLLLLKAGALALLWWCFFSPAHRTPADAAATGRHLALERSAPAGHGAAAAGKSSGDQP